MKISHIINILKNPDLIEPEDIKILLPQIDHLIKHGYYEVVKKIMPYGPVISENTIKGVIERGEYEMLALFLAHGVEILNPTQIVTLNVDPKFIALYLQYYPDPQKLMQACIKAAGISEINYELLDQWIGHQVNFSQLKLSSSGHSVATYAYLIKKGVSVKKHFFTEMLSIPIGFNKFSLKVGFNVPALLKVGHREKGFIIFNDEQISIAKLMSHVLKGRCDYDYIVHVFKLLISEFQFDQGALNELLVAIEEYSNNLSIERFNLLSPAFADAMQDLRTAAQNLITAFQPTEDFNKAESEIKQAIQEGNLEKLTLYRSQISHLSSSYLDHIHPNAVIYLLTNYKFDFLDQLCRINDLASLKMITPEAVHAARGKPRNFSTPILDKESIQALARNMLLLNHLEVYAELLRLFPEDLAELHSSLALIQEQSSLRNLKSIESYYILFKKFDNKTPHFAEFPPEVFVEARKVYTELYPIILFGLIAENSNITDTEIITERLAFLFRDTNKVIAYLEAYQKQYPTTKTPITDACAFNLTKDEIWDIDTWSKIIEQFYFPATRLLPWAGHLEAMLTQHHPALWHMKQQICKKIESEHLEILKEKFIQEVSARAHGDNNKKSFFDENLTEKLRNSAIKKAQLEIAKMTTMQFRAAVEALLSQQQPNFIHLNKKDKIIAIDDYIKKYDITAVKLEDLFTLASLHSYQHSAKNPAFARDCVLAGITEEDYDRCLAMAEKPVDNPRIPDVYIDGNIFGESHFYLKKLPRSDLSGFLAGHKTSCCQSIGGLGEDCAIHSMTSPLGGLYFLYHKKNDQPVAQAWVWISVKNKLVFDSIEFQPRVDEKMVLSFFKKAAVWIVQHTEFTQVCAGMSGHTPLPEEGERYYLTENEEPMDYDGYRDSKILQVILADKNPESIPEFTIDIATHPNPYQLLSLAIFKNDLQLVRKLLAAGVAEDIDLSDRKIPTMIDNVPMLFVAIEKNNIELFKILLTEFKIDPNIHYYYIHPVVYAASLGREEMCRLLCEDPQLRLVVNAETIPYLELPYSYPKLLPSQCAAKYGHKELASYLNQKENEYLAKFHHEQQQDLSHHPRLK